MKMRCPSSFRIRIWSLASCLQRSGSWCRADGLSSRWWRNPDCPTILCSRYRDSHNKPLQKFSLLWIYRGQKFCKGQNFCRGVYISTWPIHLSLPACQIRQADCGQTSKLEKNFQEQPSGPSPTYFGGSLIFTSQLPPGNWNLLVEIKNVQAIF